MNQAPPDITQNINKVRNLGESVIGNESNPSQVVVRRRGLLHVHALCAEAIVSPVLPAPFTKWEILSNCLCYHDTLRFILARGMAPGVLAGSAPRCLL